MLKIVVLSDTHVPERAEDMPEQVYRDLKGADLILHAGDMTSSDFMEKLADIAELKAVRGNMDDSKIKKTLPQKLLINISGVAIGLIHGEGAPSCLIDKVQNEFCLDSPDIIVFGHSHAPFNMRKNNCLLFNPGTPTDKVFANTNTYGIITIDKDIKAEIIKIS